MFPSPAMSDDDGDGDGDDDAVELFEADGVDVGRTRAWRCSSDAVREGGIADGEGEQKLWRTTGGGCDIDEREARRGGGFVGAQWSWEGTQLLFNVLLLIVYIL